MTEWELLVALGFAGLAAFISGVGFVATQSNDKHLMLTAILALISAVFGASLMFLAVAAYFYFLA